MLSNFTFEGTKACLVCFTFLRDHCALLPDSSVQKTVVSHTVSSFSDGRINLAPSTLSKIESYVIKFTYFSLVI